MIEIQKSANEINSKLLAASNILVAAHKNADGDALGSLCAISKYLDSKAKNYLLFSLDEPLSSFQYLNNVSKIEKNAEKIDPKKFDLAIILDSGDLNHVGIANLINKQNNFIINIDHHPTNTAFGHINVVIPEAVSTTEIIFHFFENINYNVDKEIATCLLTGILGDTNNFANQNTTHSSLKTASILLAAGAKIRKINDSLAFKKNIHELNLWGKVLSRLAKHEDYDIASTIITKDDFRERDDAQKSLDGITNFLNSLSDIKVAIVIREIENNKIKISLRSNDDSIDLTEFVKIFNGGGHKKAAGFSIDGKIIKTVTGWQIV